MPTFSRRQHWSAENVDFPVAGKTELIELCTSLYHFVPSQVHRYTSFIQCHQLRHAPSSAQPPLALASKSAQKSPCCSPNSSEASGEPIGKATPQVSSLEIQTVDSTVDGYSYKQGYFRKSKTKCDISSGYRTKFEGELSSLEHNRQRDQQGKLNRQSKTCTANEYIMQLSAGAV